jgi:hypothetical protein
MKEEARIQLEKIVSDYDKKLAEAERIDTERRAAHEAFPGRFVTLRAKTIQPAIQEIADMLNERGHKATVREQDESSSTEGGIKSAGVSLCIIPKPFANKSTKTNAVAIEITFSANRNERKVAVSSTDTMLGNGGTVGKRGDYEIDAVTADVVASHVIQALNEAFGRTR